MGSFHLHLAHAQHQKKPEGTCALLKQKDPVSERLDITRDQVEDNVK